MKKLVLTIAIVLGMTLGASAQYYDKDGKPGENHGLFGRGSGLYRTTDDPLLPPGLPEFNSVEDGDADAPLGSGALLLVGFGAAYAMAKKNRKE